MMGWFYLSPRRCQRMAEIKTKPDNDGIVISSDEFVPVPKGTSKK